MTPLASPNSSYGFKAWTSTFGFSFVQMYRASVKFRSQATWAAFTPGWRPDAKFSSAMSHAGIAISTFWLGTSSVSMPESLMPSSVSPTSATGDIRATSARSSFARHDSEE